MLTVINTNKKLSNLSKNPPCPGKKLLISLICNFLLIKDSIISPIIAENKIIVVNNNKK